MKAVITGAGGLVGSALAKQLRSSGAEVIPWDRRQLGVDDEPAMASFLDATQPDVLYHLATDSVPTGVANEPWLVHHDWPVALARVLRWLPTRLVCASCVWVFAPETPGPFRPETRADARDPRGYARRFGERDSMLLNANTCIARIGWQIGDGTHRSDMIHELRRRMAGDRAIRASERWYPACSFVDATAEELVRLATADPGLHLLDSNRGWSFFEIVTGLNALLGEQWSVVPVSDRAQDQRMQDGRCSMPSLASHLPLS